MALWRRWWIFSLFLLNSFLQIYSYGQVFRPPAHASTVFLRSKRANQFFVEEILPGNLERECIEEVCSYEEAREYFEDIPKTNSFWTVYVDGDQCKPSPCLHDSSCKDGVGGYTCNCTGKYHGQNCELDIAQCPVNGPSSCDHFCIVDKSYECFCTDGYTLHSNKRSCVPSVKHPCGSLQPTNQKGLAYHCPNRRCPWQVVFTDRAGAELCGGVILGPRSVLTSASCLYMKNKLQGMEAGILNISLPASTRVNIHNRHKRGSRDDDLALLRLNEPLPFGPTVFQLCLPTKDFSENVLMTPEREGVATGPDNLRGESHGHPVLSYMHTEDCRKNVNFTLSNKMFCMESKGFCGTELSRFSNKFSLLPGTPVATVVGHTAFLTGLLLSPPRSQDCEQILVFTKLSRYLPWIKEHLDKAEKYKEVRMSPQIPEYPPLP